VHEPFEPQCSFCARFVRCFPDSSPLAEWGYCLERVADRPPDAEALVALERFATVGGYRRLLARASDLGLYQETDDGCERFQAGPPQRPP
jgi:hypothetical protein